MSTFNKTYFSFDDEVERIEDEVADLEEKMDDLQDRDGDFSQEITALQAEKSQLQSQRKGAVWARDSAAEDDDFAMWDEDVDGVTLGAVRASTFGNLQNDLESDPNAGSGTSDILYVADGTVEAPYVDDDMSDNRLAGVVGQLHPWYIQWASAAIDRLMDPEGNVTSSEKSREETSTTSATE